MVIFAFLLILTGSSKAQEEATDGKGIFVANKCTACHAVKAAEIEMKKAESEGEESEEGESEDQAPDLSSVGNDHTAEWLMAYLTKKEAINGKKHMKKFKGNEDDLKVLAEWLATQKAAKE
jgi:cytochrome c553